MCNLYVLYIIQMFIQHVFKCNDPVFERVPNDISYDVHICVIYMFINVIIQFFERATNDYPNGK